MVKALFLILLSVLAVNTFALEDGKYVGKNQTTGGRCSLVIEFDGDYANHRNVEYRITIHSKGHFIDCSDMDGNEFETCASASQTNAKSEDEEKSLYMLGLGSDSIQKVYFQDTDFNSTNDVVCLNMKRI